MGRGPAQGVPLPANALAETRAAQAPEVIAKFAEQGTFTAISSSPAEFGALIAAEIPRLARVVKISGATAE
jgi:hypothetical protein